MNAVFLADFSSFQQAVSQAETKLKSFETGANRVEKSLNKMVDSFSGRRILQEATLAAEAVERIGGVAKLTESEQRRLNATITEALAKYQALGMEAPKNLQQLADATKRVETPAAALNTKMVALGSAIGSFIGSAASGVFLRLASELGEFVARGAQLPAVERSFERLADGMGQNAQVMRTELRTATQGLVSDIDLMLASNKAMLLGLPVTADNMAELARTATSLGRAMGLDATKSLDDLITALGRSSPQILDNLGLTVKLGEANEAYAAKLGKTVEEMTEAEKKMAFYEEAMRKARQRTEELGDQTKTFGEIVTTVWTSIGNVVTDQAGVMNVAVGRVLSSWQNVAEFLQDLQSGGAGFALTAAAARAAQPQNKKDINLPIPGITPAEQRLLDEFEERQKKAAANADKLAAAAKSEADAQRKRIDAITGVSTVLKALQTLEDIRLAQAQDGISITGRSAEAQKRVNAEMAAALEAGRRMGARMPEEMRAVYLATLDVSHVMNAMARNDLPEAESAMNAVTAALKPGAFSLWQKEVEAAFKASEEDAKRTAAAMGDSFTEGLMKDLERVPQMIAQGFAAGGSIGKAMEAVFSILGAHVGKKMGESIGKSLGEESGKWGGIIGGALGSLLGPGVGWLYDKLFGPTDYEKRVRANAEAVAQITQEAIKAAGGMERLRERAAIVGIQIDEAFRSRDAKWIEEVLGTVETRTALLAEAMEAYGISWEDLGERARQSKINEEAEKLIGHFDVLVMAGADVEFIIEKMGDAILEFIATAKRTGTEIPLGMKPIVQQMIDMGLLVDENGDAFESLEAAGIKFAKSFADVGADIVAAIDRIAKALGYVFDEYDGRTIRINTEYAPGTPPSRSGGTDAGGPEIHAATGFHGWVNRPTRFLAGEAGPEHVSVTPAGQMAGDAGVPAVIMLDGETLWSGLLRAGRRHRAVG